MATASAAPPRLLLRPATTDDIEAIARLWHTGWQEVHRGGCLPPWPASARLGDLRRRVAEDLGRIQVAPGEDGVAGFVTVHDDEVEQLYVAPEARGRMWPAGCWTTPSRSSPNATIGRGWPWWPPTAGARPLRPPGLGRRRTARLRGPHCPAP